MKARTSLALGCLAMLFSVSTAFAAESATTTPVKKAPAAKFSMAEKGSFHVAHSKKAKTDCDDCHTKGELPNNLVFLRLHDTLSKGSPGPVDHDTCYDCHSRASKPLPFYAKQQP